jgi:lipopolysaccharide assembly outer membrane protein LptD (OstA)
VVNNTRRKKEEKTEEKKEGLKKYWKDKTTLKCKKITYNYRDKIAYLEDQVATTQEDKEFIAQKVTWLGKEDKIILEGDVKFKDDKGQTMNCSKMVIYTKEDNEWMEIEGPLSGIFKVKEKKESSSQQ